MAVSKIPPPPKPDYSVSDPWSVEDKSYKYMAIADTLFMLAVAILMFVYILLLA